MGSLLGAGGGGSSSSSRGGAGAPLFAGCLGGGGATASASSSKSPANLNRNSVTAAATNNRAFNSDWAQRRREQLAAAKANAGVHGPGSETQSDNVDVDTNRSDDHS